jgi:LPS-assembly protein
MGPPEFRLGVNYLNMNPFSASGTYDERQEISYNIGSKFTEYWSVSAGGNNDLQSGNIMGISSSINYLDECFGLDISFGRSYARDREIEPSDSIMVSLFFKELGTFSQNQSLATQ